MQPFGKVFEADLIRRLREAFEYQVETNIQMDREEKVDFTISGNALSMPIEIQVTLQSDDGDKLKQFLRRAWFRESAAPKLYVIFAGSIDGAIAARAIHCALSDLADGIEPNRSYALWVGRDGGSFARSKDFGARPALEEPRQDREQFAPPRQGRRR